MFFLKFALFGGWAEKEPTPEEVVKLKDSYFNIVMVLIWFMKLFTMDAEQVMQFQRTFWAAGMVLMMVDFQMDMMLANRKRDEERKRRQSLSHPAGDSSLCTREPLETETHVDE